MAYYLQKPSLVDINHTMYYTGRNRWSDNASEKMTFAPEDEVRALVSNPDGKNGGWTNASIVSE